MRILIIVAAVLLLAGCMNVGTDIKPSQLSALKPGVSTLAQVEAQLGKPNTVTHNADGTTTIQYSYIHATPSASSFIPFVGPLVGHANSTVRGTTLKFTAKGVLASVSTTKTNECGGVTAC